MATLEQYRSALQRVDQATTRIGAGVNTLLERLNQPGLTEEQEAEILSQIGVHADALEGIAHNVENPVPVEPPPVEPVP